MAGRVDRALADETMRRAVMSTTAAKEALRKQVFAESFGDRYEACKREAARIKQHSRRYLARYIEQFTKSAESAGARVHFAADAREANAICVRIAKEEGSRLCVKSKSMVTEESFLLSDLEDAGVETVETDLGEFIVQLDGDAPSHIVTPMIHKDRRAAGLAMQRELGVEYSEDPSALTDIARRHLREKFRRADLGISGANFLVAETGTVVLCTNEGNAGLTVTSPNVHVVFAGIEKIIPRISDLPFFLKLLARSGTGQDLTVYTNLITGPRGPDDLDGPERLHFILMDNGRSDVLASEQDELLACIRCGACLNACPVFAAVGGGHAYGAVYSGPIGAALTPLLRGLENYPDLPQASSLCGACHEACPVDIDLPKHLVALRKQQVEKGVVAWQESLGFRIWARCMRSPVLYRLSASLGRLVLRIFGSRDAKTGRVWIRRMPGMLGSWTHDRDLPLPAEKSFKQLWQSERRKGGNV
jgi:L-lactate dehydrogenase complex protein LldF